MAYDDEGSVWGEDMAVVGAARPGAVAVQRPMLRLPPRPQWRNQLAPGVNNPGEGMETLPMTEKSGGIFTSVITSLLFEAFPQRPFRAERLIAIVSRSAGVTAIPVIRPAIFIGTHPEATSLGDVALEIFSPQAFGVRLSCVQAEPGIRIFIPVELIGTALAPGDTIACNVTFIGRSVR